MRRFAVYCLIYTKDSYCQEFDVLKNAIMFAGTVKSSYDTILVVDRESSTLVYEYDKK